MRDLDFNEIGYVYGAGGKGCSPTPPSNNHGSQSKQSKQKMSHAKTSKGKNSKAYCSCYC